MEKVAIKASFQAISKLNCAAYLSQYSDVTVKLPDCPELIQCLAITIKARYPWVSTTIILLFVIVKVAQAVTAKRIRYKEFENVKFPNIFVTVLMGSGFGKDKIINDLDTLVFTEFRNWCYEEFKKFKNRKANETNQETKSSEQQELREMVLEITDGTKEGLTSDAELFFQIGIGSLFIEHSEFWNFLANSTLDQKQLYYQFYHAYDSKIISKCTQGKPRKRNIEDVPVNLLLSSDPSLFECNLKEAFNTDLKTGFIRRLLLGYQAVKEPYAMETDARKSRLAKDKYGVNLKRLGEHFFEIFKKIKLNAIYTLTDEAYDEVLYPYIISLQKLESEEENPLLAIEIPSRELKVIRLSAIYACINHPCEFVILPKDVKQAIDTVEMISIDLCKFLKIEQNLESNCESLLEFFIAHQGKEFTTTDLKQNYFSTSGLSKREFNKSFKALIESISLIATSRGYILNETPAGNSGAKYALIPIKSEALSDGIQELEDLI